MDLSLWSILLASNERNDTSKPSNVLNCSFGYVLWDRPQRERWGWNPARAEKQEWVAGHRAVPVLTWVTSPWLISVCVRKSKYQKSKKGDTCICHKNWHPFQTTYDERNLQVGLHLATNEPSQLLCSNENLLLWCEASQKSVIKEKEHFAGNEDLDFYY